SELIMKNATASLTRKLLAIATAGVLCSTSAFAATVSVSDATVGLAGGATNPETVTVSYTADADTVGYQCNLSYPTAELDAVVAGVAGGSCSNNDGTGTIVIIDGTADNSVLGSKAS